MKQNCTGAGIIVFFDNRGVRQPAIEDLDNDILYLFMKGLDNKFDFPKGTIDFGEFPLDCAIRETLEEINLSTNDYTIIDRVGKDFFSNKKTNKHVLRMYIAEIKKDSLSNASIKQNPHTGIKEHSHFTFSSKDTCKDELLHFLKEPLEWSNNIILDYLEA